MSSRFVRTVLLLLVVSPALAQSPLSGDSRDELLLRCGQLERRSREQFGQTLYDPALRSAREVVRLTEQLHGVDAPETAVALRWVVQVHMHRTEYEKASRLMDRVVAIRKKADRDRPWLIRDAEVYRRYIRRVMELAPAEHKRLIDASQDAYTAKQMDRIGKTVASITLAEKAMEARKRVLGCADGVYLEELTFQALRLLRTKGQEEAGLRMMQQAVRMQRDLKGEMHRDHAATMRGLALAREWRGDLDEAEKLHRRAGEIFDTVLGKDHVTSLQSLEMLASAQRGLAERASKAGKFVQSARHFVDEAHTWERRHGPNHWHVFEARSRAREFQVVATFTAVQFEASDRAVDDYYKARERARLGKRREAISSMGTALIWMEATVGTRHRATRRCLWDLAELHRSAGDLDRAEELFRRWTRLTAEDLGEGHPDAEAGLDRLLEWRESQIGACLKRNDFSAALGLLAKLSDLTRQRFPGQEWRIKFVDWRGASYRDRARLSKSALVRLAGADRWMVECEELNEETKYATARALAEKALAVYRDLLAETDRATVDALHALGHLQLELGDLAQAETTMRKALVRKQRVLGKVHSQCAFTLRNLASLYLRTGNLEKAVETSEERVAISRQTLGPKHIEFVQSQVDLATVYLQLGRPDKADPLLDEALPALDKSNKAIRTYQAGALNTLAGLFLLCRTWSRAQVIGV